MQTSLKEVKVAARYAHKDIKTGKFNGFITFAVRSSDGTTLYCTTLIDGKASGCSCPSYKPCYHMKGLEAKEAARPFAAKALPVWTVELVEAGKLAAPGKVGKIAQVIEQAVAAKVPAPKKDMMKAALTKQGFSLMR